MRRNVKLQDVFNTVYKSKLYRNISGGKINSRDLSIICRKLSILLKSSCNIEKTFEIIGSEEKGIRKEAFEIIVKNLRNGSSLEKSVRSADVFSEFFVLMIRCGEESGRLEEIASDMAVYYERRHRIKSKIISMVIYPCILMMMMFFSMGFMIYFVVPNFVFILEEGEIQLPFITKFILSTALFIRENIISMIFILALTITVLIYYIKTIDLKSYINSMKNRVSFIRNLENSMFSASFSRNLHIMIKSGIPIMKSIDTASEISGGESEKDMLEISRKYLINGNSISKSLEISGMFPEMFISMLKAGEEGGLIEESLKNINEFYESELDIKIDRIIRLIEPILTIICGIIIGIVVIAIVLPMFDVISAF